MDAARAWQLLRDQRASELEQQQQRLQRLERGIGQTTPGGQPPQKPAVESGAMVAAEAEAEEAVATVAQAVAEAKGAAGEVAAGGAAVNAFPFSEPAADAEQGTPLDEAAPRQASPQPAVEAQPADLSSSETPGIQGEAAAADEAPSEAGVGEGAAATEGDEIGEL